MTHVTPTMDFWSLAWPRFVQGFSMGFIFVPLQALALATIPTERLANATAAYNVVRNIGGSIGVALVTTLLARRSQVHQATLIGHVNVWNPAMAERLREWTDHFVSQGADTFTAGRRAMAMLYRETVSAGAGAVLRRRLLAAAPRARSRCWCWSRSCAACAPTPAGARQGAEAARDPGLPAPAE